MITVDVKIGRLVEIRMVSPIAMPEIDAAFRRMASIFGGAGTMLVVCADLAGTTILSQETAGIVLNVMRSDNPRLERSGILVGNGAIFSTQLERLVTQANHPARKCFHDPALLKKYLGEVLTPAERDRVGQFLAEKA